MERGDGWRKKEGWSEEMNGERRRNGERRWMEQEDGEREGRLKECSLQYHCHGGLPILALKRKRPCQHLILCERAEEQFNIIEIQ